MDRKILATAISAVLAVSAWSNVVYAQDQTSAADQAEADKEKQDAATLATVTVTGSLIPQSQKETAAPVTTITAEDIKRQGFRNVADALRAQPLATGQIQDNQFSGGFTTGASTISLLGLSPGFTLVLIDGRPLADYPLLYNGQSNFVDLSTIPTGMVERIDVLVGNQSSIYGSAAIAGVVNIILKKHIDGIELNARLGAYTQGGGRNERFQLTGGTSWGDDLNLVYGLQYNHQDPIWGYQRSAFDSTNDNPDPNLRYGSRIFIRAINGAVYDDPGQATCDGISSLFGGTLQYDNRPGRGNYCGSRAEPGYGTTLNGEESTSGYLNGSFALNDNAELYGSLLYNVNKTEWNSGSRFWQASIDTGGFIINANSGTFDLYQRIFAPEETGVGTNNERTHGNSYNAAFGLRGSFGDSNWDYDAYFARTQYKLTDRQLWPLKDAVNTFFENHFLGPQLGTYYGYPIYAPNDSAFYVPLTPAEYASFQGQIDTKSTTWTNTFNAQITNTNLFEMPAGPVGFAALVNAGDQSWTNPTDPAVINGDFWGLTGTSGAGKRSSYAGAVEFRVPLFSALTADLSVRHDHYQNKDASSDAKTTYKLGLEFRPIDTLLIRGNYATAFRAPDMAYIYAGASGFFTTVTDYYLCARDEPGVPIADCTNSGVQVQGSRSGNLELKSITADSYGFGAVWSPNQDFDVKVDYYNVNIDDEVSDLSLDQLLQTESACRLGSLDINSPTCVDALARITRNPPGGPNGDAVTNIAINPINVSKEKIDGVILAAKYRVDGGRYGKFEFGLDYNLTLNHKYQQFPGDQTLNLLKDPFNSSEFKNVMTGDVTWGIGKWTTSIHGIRYGSTPDYAAQTDPDAAVLGLGRSIGSYMVFNGSVSYAFDNNNELSFRVNNIRNSRAPFDPTYTAYPYYNIFNYNGYGRALWLEYDLKLGTQE